MEGLAALAAAAGAAVVQAAGTDAWAGFRSKVAAWFGHRDTERERVELERLDRTAAALETVEDAERERTRQEAVWEDRFRDVLESLDEDAQRRAAEVLRALLEDPTVRDATGQGSVTGNEFHGPTAFQTGPNSRQDNRFGSTS